MDPILPGNRTTLARSDRYNPLSPYESDTPVGLVTPQAQDPVYTVWLYQPDLSSETGTWPDVGDLPAVAVAIGLQSRELAPNQQLQYQDLANGTPLLHIYALVDPRIVVAPGASVPAVSPSTPGTGYICDTGNFGANTYLSAPFTVPTVGSSVALTVDDTTPFASSTELHVAGCGIFTPVSIDSATQLTATWTGAPSALVTTVG